MSDWVELDQTKLDTGQNATIKGVTVKVFLSPFDVPEAFRAYRDAATGRFVIEFRYVGGDEPTASFEKDNVTVVIGSNSRRLLKLLLDAAKLGISAVSLELAEKHGIADLVADRATKAVGRLRRESPESAAVDYGRMTRELFREKSEIHS